MVRQAYDRRGQRVALGRELGSAGEGKVLEVCDGRNLAAKIYHRPASPEKALKIAAMTAQRTERLIRLAAWPVDTLYDRPNGEVVGFLMPIAAEPNKIHDLYGVKSRMIKFPQANWHFLVQTAGNLARAFSVVHDHGFIIGDVNEGNVFVAKAATVMLLDCDSFQATVNGKVLVPGVGVENYTPPELQGQNFRHLVRTADQDAFGLAILIFLLLFMGKHPFAGGFLGHGDMPIGKAIAEYRFAYGQHARTNQMRQPPASLPLAAVSPPVAALFERAFLRTHSGRPRPTPAEWAQGLDALTKALKLCPRHTGHVFWNGLEDCPWCTIEAAAQILLFPFISPKPEQRSGFDISAVWAQVNAVPMPIPLPTLPVRPSGFVAPSQWIIQQKQEYSRGFGAMTAALGINPKRNQARKTILKALGAAQASRHQIERRWQAHISYGMQPFTTKWQELDGKRQQYLGLPALRQQKMSQLEANRRHSQLQKYLDGYALWFADINGIGPGRKTTLQAYGIETAADIVESAILQVPGFGPTFTTKLLRWRKLLETKFVFNPAQAIDPASVARIDSELSALRRRLEQELYHGAGQLRGISQQISHERQMLVDACEQNLLALSQAEIDLRVA